MVWALAFVACRSAAPIASAPDPAAEGTAARPSILFVVLDTVRADALGAYGNPLPVSPQFDQVAAAGTLYVDATAPASWTWPAHASLFTGLYPWEHGAHFATSEAHALHPDGEKFAVSPMRTDVPTLAGQLSSAGYRTVCVTTNPLLAPALGLVRGFESATVFPEDKDTLKAALAAIADPDPRPLFLFVNFFGAHSPWNLTSAPWVKADEPLLSATPTPAWLRPFVETGYPFVHPYMQKGKQPSGGFQYMRGDLDIPPEGLAIFRDLYLGEVNLVDTALTFLIRGWNAAGHQHDLVAVTADHGDLLGERRIIGHGRVLWPEVLHVPLALVWSGRIPGGVRVRTPVQNHWLYGTLLAAAGIHAADARQLPSSDADKTDGVIRAAEWRDAYWGKDIGGPFLKSYRYYRKNDDAVIVGVDEAGAEAVALYDVRADPNFEHDRALDAPQLAAQLADDARASVPLTGRTDGVAVDPATAAQLHALGYAQ